MRRRSVRYMMNFAASGRTKALLAQVCGVVAILALVIAPACAPLCAAKICSQASGSAEEGSPCHVMAMAHGGAARIHAAQGCGAPELPAAALNSTNKKEVQDNERSEEFGAGVGIASQEISSTVGQSRDYCFAWTSSPQRSSSSSFMSILRI